MDHLPNHEDIIQEEIICDDMQMLNKNSRGQKQFNTKCKHKKLKCEFYKT